MSNASQLRITGKFTGADTEGYNVWDYLPIDAQNMRFASVDEAMAYIECNTKGPDADGIEPVWSVEVVTVERPDLTSAGLTPEESAEITQGCDGDSEEITRISGILSAITAVSDDSDNLSLYDLAVAAHRNDERTAGELVFWEHQSLRDDERWHELVGWPKCQCCSCGCDDPATTTDDASVPVCEACAEYTTDGDGDVICSRMDRTAELISEIEEAGYFEDPEIIPEIVQALTKHSQGYLLITPNICSPVGTRWTTNGYLQCDHIRVRATYATETMAAQALLDAIQEPKQ
jgi:hypothetical protein